MLLPDVFLRNENEYNYSIEVWVQQPDKPKNELRKLTDEERDNLTIEILIPAKMKMTDHNFISGIKQKRGSFQYLLAKVARRTREFNLHFRLSEEGHYVLADLPTVLSTLNESIKSRRRIHDLIETEEWSIPETQELERFANKCTLFKDTVVEKYPYLHDRIDVV